MARGNAGPIRPRRPNHRKQRGFFRRHKALASLGVLLLLLALVLGGGYFYLNHQLSQIDRVPIALPERDRPAPAPTPEGETHRPLNILLGGADNGAARVSLRR